MNNKFKRKFFTIFLSLFLLLGINTPSFAGSGTDGIIEVTWKDINKSKAKNCYVQRVYFSTNMVLIGEEFIFINAIIYNNDDEAITYSAIGIIKQNQQKKSAIFRFCKPLGPKPYYVHMSYTLNNPTSQERNIDGEFDIPYKFKK